MIIPSLSYHQYKKAAEEILNRGGADHSALPTDVELLVDRLGMHIIPYAGLKRNCDIKGVVLKRKFKPGFDIGIDQYHWEHEEQGCQFTIAEELAHVFIHTSLFSGLTEPEDVVHFINSIPVNEYRKMEQQARNVASFILLPDKPLRKYVLEFSKARADFLRKQHLSSKEELARELADKIGRSLNISASVLSYVILGRYPAPLIIDSVLEENDRLL